jgi:hypothetical protein
MDRDYVDWSFARSDELTTRIYYVTVEYTYEWQRSANWFSADRWEIFDWSLRLPATMQIQYDVEGLPYTFHPLSEEELNSLALTREETRALLEFLDSLGCPSNAVYSSYDE